MKKKLILFVVDALTPRVLLPAMAKGQLPNLKKLAEAGQLDPTCSTIFPSITHAALSSIATGSYPNVHGIPGGYWFDIEEQQVVHYTDDLWAILNGGVGDFFKDMLMNWNRERIKADTIFEIVERAGYKAACINHLVHRGSVPHTFNTPLLGNLLPGVSEIDELLGPSMLYIGDLVQTPLPDASDFPPSAGLMRRYGLDDQYSAEMLLYLAQNDALPDFTVAYFMDNDYESHKTGPEGAVDVLENLDATIGEFAALYGGIDGLLDEFCIVMTGDHSQDEISDNEAEAVIILDKLLNKFQIAPVGTAWSEADDLVICPNMRAVHIYLNVHENGLLEDVVKQLLSDRRIDQVLWCVALTEPEQRGYHIATAERGMLHFWPNQGEGDDTIDGAMDDWGCRWCWRGDLRAVDGCIEHGVVKFDAYPNAFERIAGALEASNGGHIWATAHPGIDFQLDTSTVHIDGGSHGSLHKLDSLVPLLLAGAPDDISLPDAVRTVDILPLCLDILGVESEYVLGSSHIYTNGPAC